MLSPYHSVAFFIHSSFFRHKSCISHRPRSQSPWFWKVVRSFQIPDFGAWHHLATWQHAILAPSSRGADEHLGVKNPRTVMNYDFWWDCEPFWSDEQPMSQSHIGHLRLLCRVTVQEELCSVLWLQRLQFQVVCLHPAEGVLDLEPRRKALQLSDLE